MNTKPLIIGNWKCNPATLREARQIFNPVKKGVKNIREVEVVICPPFVYLSSLKGLTLGAQNCFWEEKGAYTGETSPLMLSELGVEYVVVGHSERRKYQKETNEMVEKKLRAALKLGLKPVLCVDKISQLPRNIKRGFIVAYEPLFAIGTGKACSIEKAKKMRILIQKKVRVSVIYGGSVNSQNARNYIKKAGFQGLLVGGASLKPKEFIDLVRNSLSR